MKKIPQSTKKCQKVCKKKFRKNLNKKQQKPWTGLERLSRHDDSADMQDLVSMNMLFRMKRKKIWE